MTTQLHDLLDDPSRWEVRAGVPIFDEHDEWHVPDPKAKGGYREVHTLPGEQPPPGAKLYDRIDAARLQKICDNMNRRERDSGEYCPIMIGHTLPGRPETEQPRIVGYNRGYQVGTFGPSKRRAVLTSHYFRKDRFAEAQEYPRRSVEFWRDDNILDPLALLKRTPRRDLGTAHYSRSDHRRTFYAMEDLMDPTAAPPAAAPAAGGSPELDAVYVRKDDPVYMAMAQQLAPPPPADGAGGPPPGAAPFQKAQPDAEAARMQRDQDAIQGSRYAREVEALRAEMTALRAENAAKDKEARVARYERGLQTLLGIGYQFDLVKEMKDCAEMSQEQFDRHRQRIAENYQRSPAGGAFVPVADDGPDAGPARYARSGDTLSPEEAKRVGRHAQAKGLSYEDAKAALYPDK